MQLSRVRKPTQHLPTSYYTWFVILVSISITKSIRLMFKSTFMISCFISFLLYFVPLGTTNYYISKTQHGYWPGKCIFVWVLTPKISELTCHKTAGQIRLVNPKTYSLRSTDPCPPDYRGYSPSQYHETSWK